MSRLLRIDAAAIAGLWLLYAVPQVSAHGLTCDSPSLFYAGDRTLFWIEHGAPPDTLDFDDIDPATGLTRRSPPGFETRYFPYPDARDPMHYPVFSGVVAAFVAQLAGHLGVDAIPGHHLGLVLLHAIGLFWFTLLSGRIFGRRAGLLAGAFLLFFPEAVGQAFNNAKDWPCVDFYACAMLAAMEALLWRRPGAAVRAGVFAGIALSCKLNAVFALLCIDGLGAVVLARGLALGKDSGGGAGATGTDAGGTGTDAGGTGTEAGGTGTEAGATGTALALAGINALAGALFLLLWPYLYHGPPSTWWPHLREYLHWYADYGKGPRATWTDFPLRPLLFATPPLTLICAALGLGVGARLRGPDRWSFWFTVAWIAFPLARSAMPHSNFYDGNRHFMEYIPGLCVVAGLGADWIVRRLETWLARTSAGRQHRMAVAAAATAVLALGLLVPLLLYRPFEGTYFNFLIGGLGGAQRHALYDMPEPHDGRVRGTEGDYWYGGLGDGLPRVRQLLKPDQAVSPCGPGPQQLDMMWPEGAPRVHRDPADGDLLYLSPREIFCGFDDVRAKEQRRPILYRAERGGGLVYEILGAVDGQPHPIVTPRTLYSR